MTELGDELVLVATEQSKVKSRDLLYSCHGCVADVDPKSGSVASSQVVRESIEDVRSRHLVRLGLGRARHTL